MKLDLKGPSAREIRNLIVNKVRVEFYTTCTTTYVGLINWFDETYFNITLDNGKVITLAIGHVVYFSALSS